MLEILFSSRVRAKILTAFFLSPGVEHNAWKLGQALHENYSAVWKELLRLESLGILAGERRGNAKAYRVNSACFIVPELRSLILKTEGVGNTIRQIFLKAGGIEKAFIYGSYVTGEADEQSDLDVMIIGTVDLNQFSLLIANLEKELNRPINYAIFSEKEWDERIARDDPFASNVENSPKIMLIGGEYAL